MISSVKKNISLFIGVFILDILIIYILKSNNLWMNIESINNYNQIVNVGKYPDINKLKSILPKYILFKDNDFIVDIKKSLNYVANIVDGRYISNQNFTAYQKLNSILKSNGGGICGDLAIILKEILIIKGYQARTIQLTRQLGSSYDTHVVTEVFDKKLGKFIMLDPMFNLMFKDGYDYKNAIEVRDWYLYNNINKLQVEELKGKNIVNYKEYYVNYFSLFNNVMIVKINELIGMKRNLTRIPVIQKFINTKYYNYENKELKVYGILYDILYFYIPIFFLINLIFILFIRRYKDKKVVICVE